MTKAQEFYTSLHCDVRNYAAGNYCLNSLFSIRPLENWMARKQGGCLRVLDAGCGRGLFLRDFLAEVRERWRIQNIEVTGTDLVFNPANHFQEISRNFRFVQQNLEGKPLSFVDSSFDFLSCNHVLEQVFETEKLMREFRRVLAPDGLCLVSVPNLAAWANRVALLFGGQTLGSELGTEQVTYGFWPGFLQHKLRPFRPSGHIRDFTPRGLADLARHCGFKPVGWWAQSPGLVARLGIMGRSGRWNPASKG